MDETSLEFMPLPQITSDRRTLAQLLAASAGYGHDLDPCVQSAHWQHPEPPMDGVDLIGLHVRKDVGHAEALRLMARADMRPGFPEEAVRLALQHPDAFLCDRPYLAAGRMALQAGKMTPYVLEILRDARNIIHFDLVPTTGTWAMASEYIFLVAPDAKKGTARVRT